MVKAVSLGPTSAIKVEELYFKTSLPSTQAALMYNLRE